MAAPHSLLAVAAVAAVAAVTLGACATAGEPGNAATPDAARVQEATPDAAHAGSCAQAFTGTLATWDFTADTGTEIMSAASATAPGVTASPVTRSADVSAASGASSMNATNWALAAHLDATKYYTLTLTPPGGCTLAITGLAVDAKASASGPSAASIATSADMFAAVASLSTTAPSTPAIAATATTALELRVYGFSATSAAGTFRVQNQLTVTGSLR